MSIRAFIAVEIDKTNKQRLSKLISDLKKSNTDIKWVSEHQMHLTLKFLGNIEQDRVQVISDALKSIADNFKGFDIRLSKIGAFPNLRRPRVIWLDIDKGAEELKSLSSKIEIELEKIGFKKEKREFKSHLTLGRVRSLKNIENLEKIINKTDFQPLNEIKIDKLVLFQSTLTPKGATYTQLVAAELALLKAK